MHPYEKTVEEIEQHMVLVQKFITLFCVLLRERAYNHDKSKLEPPEIEHFSAIDRRTLDIKYGSPEYEHALTILQPALEAHYAQNRHHPEHHPEGIRDMNLIDLIEMFLDWMASTKRHKHGNILKSIEINAKRFDLCDDLVCIFRNTAVLYDNLK